MSHFSKAHLRVSASADTPSVETDPSATAISSEQLQYLFYAHLKSKGVKRKREVHPMGAKVIGASPRSDASLPPVPETPLTMAERRHLVKVQFVLYLAGILQVHPHVLFTNYPRRTPATVTPSTPTPVTMGVKVKEEEEPTAGPAPTTTLSTSENLFDKVVGFLTTYLIETARFGDAAPVQRAQTIFMGFLYSLGLSGSPVNEIKPIVDRWIDRTFRRNLNLESGKSRAPFQAAVEQALKEAIEQNGAVRDHIHTIFEPVFTKVKEESVGKGKEEEEPVIDITPPRPEPIVVEDDNEDRPHKRMRVDSHDTVFRVETSSAAPTAPARLLHAYETVTDTDEGRYLSVPELTLRQKATLHIHQTPESLIEDQFLTILMECAKFLPEETVSQLSLPLIMEHPVARGLFARVIYNTR